MYLILRVSQPIMGKQKLFTHSHECKITTVGIAVKVRAMLGFTELKDRRSIHVSTSINLIKIN